MQVHLLDYNEETGVLDKTVFMHSAGEIWSVIFVVDNLPPLPSPNPSGT